MSCVKIIRPIRCPHNSLCKQNGEATAANCVVKGSFGMFWKAIKREIKSTSGAGSCGHGGGRRRRRWTEELGTKSRWTEGSSRTTSGLRSFLSPRNCPSACTNPLFSQEYFCSHKNIVHFDKLGILDSGIEMAGTSQDGFPIAGKE